jgi:hypothetical protein
LRVFGWEVQTGVLAVLLYGFAVAYFGRLHFVVEDAYIPVPDKYLPFVAAGRNADEPRLAVSVLAPVA